MSSGICGDSEAYDGLSSIIISDGGEELELEVALTVAMVEELMVTGTSSTST